MATVLEGEWMNQHGSRLMLKQDQDGRLTGSFMPGVGFGRNEAFEVSGFARDDLVAFAVDFRAHRCLTSWCGHIIQDGSQPDLETLWQMAVHVPGTGAVDAWKGLWSGSDLFTRGRSGGRRAHGRPSHPVK